MSCKIGLPNGVPDWGIHIVVMLLPVAYTYHMVPRLAEILGPKMDCWDLKCNHCDFSQVCFQELLNFFGHYRY